VLEQFSAVVEKMPLEDRIEFWEKASDDVGREPGSRVIGRDKWLGSMDKLRTIFHIPPEFVAAWADKQDWPLTYREATMVNVAWWKQLIKWRDGGLT
jgi:hypothetical protein